MFTKGIKHMLLAGIFFSIMNLGVKYLKHIPAIEIVFFRSLISLIISSYMLKRLGISMLGNNKPILILRGVFGILALSLFFFTLQEMPIASAVTFQQLSPIFTSILAIFLLKEKVRIPQWVFFAIAFAGVALIKGFDSNINIYHFLAAVGSAFFSGLAYNMVRKLKDTDHPLVVVLYFPLIALPIAGIFSYFYWVMPQGIEWLILLGIGVSTQIAQVNLTKALQMEKVGTVSIVQYLTVIYAIFFGFVLFDEGLILTTVLGIVLVITGVILNLLYSKKSL
jgi:drug/metabolite transporter (DMT)-like permease